MSAKAKIPILKGQEAEDKILEYVKSMNRPYGAVDVAANLKGAVPKATTQKILVSLAEKGELVQKLYGKTTFFVANQANMECMPAEKIAELEVELKTIEENNKLLSVELKSISAELSKIRSSPTDAELDLQITATSASVEQLITRIQPLRAGAPPISAEDRAQVDAEWTKWRAEWIKRKKVFDTFWQFVIDSLPPQEAASLAEDLGIELDTPEHRTLERSAICAQKNTNSLKRKRRLIN